MIIKERLTDFNSVPAEEEPRQNHLSETKFRTECREEADWNDTQEVDKEDCQDSIDESEVENGIC